MTMYKLQQLNVVKVVETDAARDDLIARGFVDVAGAKSSPRAAAEATEEKTEKPPTKRRASAKAR